MNILKKYIYAFLIIFVAGPFIKTASAQNIYYSDSFVTRKVFEIDYAQYKGEDRELNRLEIYYKIFTSGLQFVREGNRFRADYEVTGTIYDNDGRQITAFSNEKSITVASYNATVSLSDFRISQVDRYLPPGKYKIEFHLGDKNAGNDYKSTLKAELIRYDNRNPQLSSIELVRAVDTAFVDSVFRKGNLTIIPAVSRQVSGDINARLLYYIEVYQGHSKKNNVEIITRILNKKLHTVYVDTLATEFSESEDIIREVRHVTLDNIESGDYSIDVELRSRRNKVVDRMRTDFFLYWSPEAMILNDFSTAVAQLRYIADPGEIKDMKNAATEEERLSRWNDFWLARDPSPGTPENEIKDTYYNRIAYTNRNFGVMKKAGWSTDRGMIYIEYGEPDQVEDYPFELDSKAYQIWYYYRHGDPRKFVFIDEWGDNDFRLLYPYDGRIW